jgi:hypothetical protein
MAALPAEPAIAEDEATRRRREFELAVPLRSFLVHPYEGPVLASDVVRPINHRFAVQAGDETATWKIKNTDRCPTYGSCDLCFKSGPVGKTCNLCGDSFRYRVVFYRYKILDSITIAEILEKGHEEALGDRTYRWCSTPVMNLNQDLVQLSLERHLPREQRRDPVLRRQTIQKVSRVTGLAYPE